MGDKEIVDIQALMDRVDGDRELLADLVSLFLERSSQAMESIELAIVSQDAKGLEASAHSLRGYLVSLHAERAAAVALQLELKGRLGDAVGLRYLFSKLEEEIEQLKPVLAHAPKQDSHHA